MSFAKIQSRINAAVGKQLSNATASYQGSAAFGVLLDSAPTELFGGVVDTATCTIGFDGAHAPGIAEGQALVINGTSYRVTGGTVPNEAGWLNLTVQPQ